MFAETKATDVLQGIGSLLSGLGIFIALFQYWFNKHDKATSFEDDLNREYRTIISALPYDSFTRAPLPEAEIIKYKQTFFQYFDLCNEQIFLRKSGRISDKTWAFWLDGIKGNICGIETFRIAWSLIKSEVKNDVFEQLRLLENSDWKADPIM